MEDDLNVLWPLLVEYNPKARLGLSRGKPAVFRWHPDHPGIWPLDGDSWASVIRQALDEIRCGKQDAIEAVEGEPSRDWTQ